MGVATYFKGVVPTTTELPIFTFTVASPAVEQTGAVNVTRVAVAP